MNKTNFFVNFFKKMADNDPIYAVVSIAACKAITCPYFALTDKSQPKENRLYSAARDLVVEMIAIPAYIIMKKIGETQTKKLTVIDKNIFNNLKGSKGETLNHLDKAAAIFKNPDEKRFLKDVIKHIEKHEHIDTPNKKPIIDALCSTDNYHVTKTSLKLTMVCATAALIIPALCNAALPHVMKFFKPNSKGENLYHPSAQVLHKNINFKHRYRNTPIANLYDSNPYLTRYNMLRNNAYKNSSNMRIGN